MTEQTRRLYRSRSNRMIAGVCAGIAEYLDIDPTIVRLLWFLSIFLWGVGVILYLAAVIIMPSNPSTETVRPLGNQRYFWGLLLVGFGVLLLFFNMGIVPLFFWWGVSWKVLFALLLILAGSLLVFSHYRERESTSVPAEPVEKDKRQRRLYRSLHDRKLFGVCGGIGEYFQVDPTIVRLFFVFITLYSFGFGILAYLLLTIVTPEERMSTTAA